MIARLDVAASSPPLLQAQGVGKSFPGVRALAGVDLTLSSGEVLALVGENGAGKSTLMKILAGVETPDAGRILLDGRPVEFRSARDALDAGVVLIHQELNLIECLDVGANIFLGREPRRAGLIDRKTLYARAASHLAQVGLAISPRAPVSSLSIGQRQMVEIAKALSADARVLIMDEPTSSLSQHEMRRLFEVVNSLRSKGIGIIYISHRLGEVTELADRVTVMRDGRNAGELSREQISHDAMVRLMVGRDFKAPADHAPRALGDKALEVRGLRTAAHPSHELNFTLRFGEVVGVAGLVGAGRTELFEALFGLTPPVAGEIEVAGRSFTPVSPCGAIAAGLALVPEDRKQQGLLVEMAVRDNVTLASLRDGHWSGLRSGRRERQECRELIERLRVKTPTDRQIAQHLSGGNQQKVVLGKWLTTKPRVLLLDEPTRGVDVGSKQEIYALIHQLAEAGMAVLFISSDMEEILRLSERAMVMHEGRITGSLERQQLNEETVMRLATGGECAMSTV